MAATEFYHYAINWWDQLVSSWRINGEHPVETWTELKSIMRKRFVTNHYHQELHQNIRSLTQGAQNVEDYFQEMETLMIRDDIVEYREETMSMAGLVDMYKTSLRCRTTSILKKCLTKQSNNNSKKDQINMPMVEHHLVPPF